MDVIVCTSISIRSGGRFHISTNNGTYSGAVAESKAPELKEGQHARVYLRSGEMHEGEVVAVSETQVTLLGQPTNRGYSEHAFEIVDIEKCEVESLTPVGAIVAVAFGLAVVAFAVFAWGMRDFGEGWN